MELEYEVEELIAVYCTLNESIHCQIRALDLLVVDIGALVVDLKPGWSFVNCELGLCLIGGGCLIGGIHES